MQTDLPTNMEDDSPPPGAAELPPRQTQDRPTHSGLCGAYVPPATLFDEMEERDGSVRPHWNMFVNLLDDLGPTELHRRLDTARQLIHDNGVTYNVYGDPAGMDRPWNLDAIPMLFGPEEWQRLADGLTQRARLFDAILFDIYGPQRTLHEGILPHELIFSHPNFLRPMHGVQTPGSRWMHLYAADICRGPDGNLWVMGDRTQAPSGAGYALENRLVISRALPDVFRDCRVRRLATYFRTMRETLKALAPHNRDNPRIVLLTPGPYNETYFEHAYLARYLGYTLVEAGDLTVRDNHVYLKTLGGLQQVDVVLRRQDDDFCDALELRNESTLGIPGLVQAVYAGNVAIANALGSGILETPALLGYLPRLCKFLLGEELRMPSVNSFWCGEATGRSHVLANLHRMVIKLFCPGPKREVLFGKQLSQRQLEDLRARILACPREFVGEEQITLSTAPVLVGNKVVPRHVSIRAHLVATPDGYAVMPGGLTRFSASADTMVVSMQKGGGSKDTWVLSGGPVDPFSLLQPAGQAVEINRSGGDLPSRVADNLYWLGRYMERAEGLARVCRGTLARLADTNLEAAPELLTLLTTLSREGSGEGTTEKADLAAHPEQRLARILFDETYPQGLQSTLGSIYRIASLVRDRISVDTWRIINRFDEDFPSTGNLDVQINEILPALDRLIITFAAFGGLAMESMTRGHAWRFLDMGRRVERSLQLIALLRGTLAQSIRRESALLEAVLEIADSALTYRRRYLSTLQVAPVLDLLLCDESNPRAVAFQLSWLTEHVEALPRAGGTTKRSAEERILLRILTAVRLLDVNAEATVDASGRRPRLEHLLTDLSTDVYSLSDMISQSYLSHAVASRQLGTMIHNIRHDTHFQIDT